MNQSTLLQGGAPMKEIKVKATALLEKVRANREGHRAEFERAIERYRAVLLNELEVRIDDLRHGRSVDHYIRIPIPEDHTVDYDQVILMLEMSEEPVVTIDYRTFRQYAMDEWDWKEAVTQTNSFYEKSR